MSYTAYIGPVPKSELTEPDLAAALAEAIAPIAEANPDQADAMDDHAKALAKALPELVAVVGPDDALVRVSVSGHANPGHEPVEGWADDAIHVDVVFVP
jgi:hypothetical protein